MQISLKQLLALTALLAFTAWFATVLGPREVLLLTPLIVLCAILARDRTAVVWLLFAVALPLFHFLPLLLQADDAQLPARQPLPRKTTKAVRSQDCVNLTAGKPVLTSPGQPAFGTLK